MTVSKQAKSKRIGRSAAKRRPTTAEPSDKATTEEFEQEGLGLAAKE